MITNELDQRIVRVGVSVDGVMNWYEGLDIEVKGIKVSSTLMGECEITILNVRRSVREYILRETNPYLNKGKRISVQVEVGRESMGVSVLYTGDVYKTDPMPKPDMGVRMSCAQGSFNKANIISLSSKEVSKLSAIAKWCADANGYDLVFGIDDKNVGRYSFTGSAQSSFLQLEELCGDGIDVFVDNSTLHVKNSTAAVKGSVVRELSYRSGLMKAGGTDYGCKVQFLFDNVTTVGGQINLVSSIDPSLNGSYIVRRLGFNITSRGVPFYYSAECDRIS